ncbi:FtsJ-like methyltransferase-domain-containing protein [Zopfochytrium polystomum]|nr:FtsJ-like methyltransferase-domain-containing protein [Zopfochytrium polystomum]
MTAATGGAGAAVFRRARALANPHESVAKSVFVNRSAVKLANLDALLLLVRRRDGKDDKDGKDGVDHDDGDKVDDASWPSSAWADARARRSLRFADLCAGPGGFVEYLLWRWATTAAAAASSSSSYSLRPAVRGFGMTLRGDQDMACERFHAAARGLLSTAAPPAPKTTAAAATAEFTALYGADGSGDVTDPANVEHFARAVRAALEGEDEDDQDDQDKENEEEEGGDGRPRRRTRTRKRDGVDLVVADGGFSCKGDELHQEEHGKALLVGQVLAALLVLKTDASRDRARRVCGDFIVKTFSQRHPVTVGVLYLLRRCFARIAVVKPVASRPANAERYVVAQGFCGRRSRSRRRGGEGGGGFGGIGEGLHAEADKTDADTVTGAADAVAAHLARVLGTLWEQKRAAVDAEAEACARRRRRRRWRRRLKRRATVESTSAAALSSHTRPPCGFEPLARRVRRGDADVRAVVRLAALMADGALCDYVLQANITLDARQESSLLRIEAVADLLRMAGARQTEESADNEGDEPSPAAMLSDEARDCLRRWRLPEPGSEKAAATATATAGVSGIGKPERESPKQPKRKGGRPAFELLLVVGLVAAVRLELLDGLLAVLLVVVLKPLCSCHVNKKTRTHTTRERGDKRNRARDTLLTFVAKVADSGDGDGTEDATEYFLALCVVVELGKGWGEVE